MDEVQFFHFDSNTQRIVPKPAWVDQLTRDDPDYLERETGYLVCRLTSPRLQSDSARASAGVSAPEEPLPPSGVDLNLTAVPQEDWGRYECVVQLKGIEDISTPLDPALIRTNWDAPPRRSTVDVVSLQRQLLEEVRMLRRTLEQLLQVEREKLLVEREKLRLAQAKSD
ncbi:unnamed protein product [Gadus morhua 'NCC']